MLDGFSLAKLGPGSASVTGRAFRVRGAVHAGLSGRWCWCWCWSFGACWSCVPCLGWILGLACLSLLRGAISMPTLFLAVSLLLSSRARSKLLLLPQRRQLSRSRPTVAVARIVHSDCEASKGSTISIAITHTTHLHLHLIISHANSALGQSPSAIPLHHPALNIAIPSIQFPLLGLQHQPSASLDRPPAISMQSCLQSPNSSSAQQ